MSRSRRFALKALGLYAMAAVVFLALGGGAPSNGPTVVAVDIHGFEYETLDGEATSLGAFAGQPLIINFFASTCLPCVQEMPDFEDLHQAYGTEVVVVGLAVEGARPARGIVAETGITYPTGLEGGKDFLIDLGGYGMPTTVFVSPDGTVLESHTGILTPVELRERLEGHFGIDT
ncbi:MAG: TlpA family protein disulfide reductase [Acidimicrobiales bacterium]|jgi:thiol-disulfide isomerase/thioredoxin